MEPLNSHVEQLKSKFTDQYVQADETVPELARFKGIAGRVVTVNENGHALVDFKDGAWYDVPTSQLRIVPKPAEPVGEKAGHGK